MTGSNNLGDNTNVEEDNANMSQCAETDTEVETDDEEENTDDITDPTRVVEPRPDLENTQVDQEIVGLIAPVSNSVSVRDTAQIVATGSYEDDVIDGEKILAYATAAQMDADRRDSFPQRSTPESITKLKKTPSVPPTRKRKRKPTSGCSKKKQKKKSVFSKSRKYMIQISPGLHSYYTGTKQSGACYVPVNVVGELNEEQVKVEIPHLAYFPVIGAPIICMKTDLLDRTTDKQMTLPVPEAACQPKFVSR